MTSNEPNLGGLSRRRTRPLAQPITENIVPEGLDGVASTETVQLARDRLRYRAQVGRDRLVATLIGVVVAAGAGAVFTDRLDAETFLGTCFGALVGYFVRGHGEE